MEILATPANDAAMSRKRTKRITGARELTANEYVGMLQEEKRKMKQKKRDRKRKRRGSVRRKTMRNGKERRGSWSEL